MHVRLTAILGEAAIHQQVGGPDILCEQLRHITRLIREHDVTVQVVPFAFSHPAWAAFVCDARDGIAPTNGVAEITRIGTDTLVASLTTEVELRFDQGEWSAFLAGVADGEFDFTDQFAA